MVKKDSNILQRNILLSLKKGGAIIKDYEITLDTLLIIPINSNQSKIIEKEKEFIIDVNPWDIIKVSCEYFGSSYDGRHSGTKKLIGITHKSPIIIEEYNEIVFFPTVSPRDETCIWICLNEIKNYYRSNYFTTIEFNNGYKYEIEISYGTINNQILRATRLQSVLKKRTNLYEKKVSF